MDWAKFRATGQPARLRSRLRRGMVVGLVVGLLAAGCSESTPRPQLAEQPGNDGSSALDQSQTERSSKGADGSGEQPDWPADQQAGTGADTEPGPIRVDQFGYRPADPKVAVIADPEVGFDSEVDFTPGTRIEVRRISDDQVVHAGEPELWADGSVHEQSGDRGWWFDFSPVAEPGDYYLIDVDSGAVSVAFRVADDVYDEVLDASLRMFWYNRANTPHPQDIAGPWSDGAAYLGPGQDTEARSVNDRSDASSARDLSGGWFDAGDTNKYVSFASEPVHLLLTAYRLYPEVFDDAVGIPESGNGVADVLDELVWELQWLERMQQEDGGVLVKVGLVDDELSVPPSSSDMPRYYEAACSSSTIAAAGMFAHAAVVFAEVPELRLYGEQLAERAQLAWDWFQASERRDDCDPQVILYGDADLSIEAQAGAEVLAAAYLFALTGDGRYSDAVGTGLASTVPFQGDGFGNYSPDQSDAILFYRQLPAADRSVVQAIEQRIDEVMVNSPLFGFDPAADLYRAFLPDYSYHWGSNMVKANAGSANLALDPEGGRERALGHLHYFHGVNPLAMVYLSNMGQYGAERSAQSLFHFWFGEGTDYDVGTGSTIGVAPGYLVGGPNHQYSGTATPPAGQPPLKSFRDWAGAGSDRSWEISEPAIYYQAAYVRLLAAVQASG